MDAPKIEVTDTNPSNEPPLYPKFCEGVSDEWTDLRYHGDSGDNLVRQSLKQQQEAVYASHDDSCSPHRRSYTKRSEGGPGKSPSPSRTSPRRHAPVPYSPKRQHRHVTSDDLYDVTLSPRRHSPIRRLGEETRALSLTSDELICVSYSDPFASAPTAHTPEGVVAISVDCSHDIGSDQVEEIATNDLNDTGMVRGGLDRNTWLDSTCVSPGDSCLQDTLELLEGQFQGPTEMLESVPQDGDLFLYEVDEERPASKNRNCVTDAERGHFMAAKCSFPTSYYESELMSQNFCEELCPDADSSDWKINNCVQDGQVPVMENRDSFVNTTAICTDSSSDDDDMEEAITFRQPDGSQPHDISVSELDQIIAMSQSHSHCGTTTGIPQISRSNMNSASQLVLEGKTPVLPLCAETRVPASQHFGLDDTECVPLADDPVKEPSFQRPSQDCFLEELTSDDPTWCFSEEDKMLTSKSESSDIFKPCFSIEEKMLTSKSDSSKSCSEIESKLLLDLGDESRESTDLKILQHFSNEYHSSSCIFPVDLMPSASPPTHHDPGDCSSLLPASSSLQTSPRNTSWPRVSKTPEDFTLSRLVGSPPLHFPHCQNVVLIHRALSSPYDPDLPTPPIVLTPDDSYDHLNLNLVHDDLSQPVNDNFDAFEESSHLHFNPVTFTQGSKEGSGGEYRQRDDISRSVSCPNLSHGDSNQVQKPYEHCSVWGQSHHHQDNFSACAREEGQCAFTKGSYSSGRYPVWSSLDRDSDSANMGACFSVPSSQGSTRAAVINRLRQVVERRISGSLDSLEASLHEG